jgi:predicted DNA-binding transcriptional regulator YafY
MARKRTTRAVSVPETVTAKRAARLYRMLRLLSSSAQTRSALARRLRLDVRGFYRDLVLLRDCGIDLPLEKGRYQLTLDLDEAVSRLPFPDPHLTLAEAMQLAKGRTAAHRKLKKQVDQIIK